MPTTLATHAIEQSTYAVTASFTDDTGASLVPNAGLTWSLYKKVGATETIVNSRDAVAIDSASAVTVVLSGDDLALVAGESKTRYLLFEGTYDSDLGTDLPFKHQVVFSIDNLIGVA